MVNHFVLSSICSNFVPEFRIYILREAALMSSINFLFAKDTTL